MERALRAIRKIFENSKIVIFLDFLKDFFELATGGRRAPSGGMLLASRVVGGRWPERGKGFIGGVLRCTEN